MARTRDSHGGEVRGAERCDESGGARRLRLMMRVVACAADVQAAIAFARSSWLLIGDRLWRWRKMRILKKVVGAQIRCGAMWE